MNFENDGTEDDFIHYLKKGRPFKAGRQKLSSHLSLLVGKSDAVNLLISPSNEEDTNEVIEDEVNE